MSKFHWGKAILVFFILFIGLNVAFVIFSLQHKIELVEADYYDKGASYSESMKEKKRSEVFMDKLEITQKHDSLWLCVLDSTLLKTDTMFVHFYCPSNQAKDRNILLSPLKEQNWLNPQGLFPGRYIVKLHWNIGQLRYSSEKNLLIP